MGSASCSHPIRDGGIPRLFLSTRQGSTWSPPVVLAALDSGQGEGGPAWNASGDRLYFASRRAGAWRLYASEVTAGVFGAPTLVPGLESLTRVTAPTVRADEQEMFFSNFQAPSRIERATRGSLAETWRPEGEVVELAGEEDHGYPGISPDGRALYLEVTQGPRFKIFRALRAAADAPFSAPEPVLELDGGPDASDGDAQVSFDGAQVYLTSDRADAGDFDLYVADRICP